MVRHRLGAELIVTAAACLACSGQVAGQVVLSKTFGASKYASLRDVGNTGDVDGDGVPDYVVGLPAEQSGGLVTGVARVVSGKDSATLLLVAGHEQYDAFGWSADGAGDIDQDGHADLVVGAIESYFGSVEPGYARVVAGSDGHTIYEWVGSEPGQQFGQCVVGIGDYNVDGFDDILVSKADAIGSGTAWVHSGKTGLVIGTFKGTGGKALGFSADCAGDVNADGVLDIILGTYHDNFAEVVEGGSGAVLQTFTDPGIGGYFGLSVAGVGDVDADGYADVAVGNSMPFSVPGLSGYVDVFSGQDGSVVGRLVGEPSVFGTFGDSIAPAGDINGDGRADVAVGASWAGGDGIFPGPGTVSVFDVEAKQRLWLAQGTHSACSFGFSLCSVGDVNGDGLSEIATGALSEDLKGVPGVGSACVLSTSTSNWTDVGHGSQTATTKPMLEGTGPTPAGAIVLDVSHAAAFAPAVLIVGSAFAGWPLQAVILVPTPEIVVAGLQTDAGGTWHLVSHAPEGIPAGTVFYLQVLLFDPGSGLAATNGLAFTAR